jgi:hypothetical protein
MRNRKAVELVREGKYAAEVTVELIDDEGSWSGGFANRPEGSFAKLPRFSALRSRGALETATEASAEAERMKA